MEAKTLVLAKDSTSQAVERGRQGLGRADNEQDGAVPQILTLDLRSPRPLEPPKSPKNRENCLFM
eukprot:1665323-Amphidinium_carterae.1